jgi:hypothetical protein
MTSTRPILLLAAVIALSGCAALEQRAQRDNITIVNAVSWPDSVDGTPHRERARLTLTEAHGRTEHYPLMQIKSCKEGGRDCVWGVARVDGTIRVRNVTPGQVDLSVAMNVDIARRQEVALPGFSMMLELPKDITAFSHQRKLTHDLSLAYGKVQQIDLDYGMKLDLCVARNGADGKPADACPAI